MLPSLGFRKFEKLIKINKRQDHRFGLQAPHSFLAGKDLVSKRL